MKSSYILIFYQIILLLGSTIPATLTASANLEPLVIEFDSYYDSDNQEYLSVAIILLPEITPLVDNITIQLIGINGESFCTNNEIHLNNFYLTGETWQIEVPVGKDWPQYLKLWQLKISFQKQFVYWYSSKELTNLHDEEIFVNSGWDNSLVDNEAPVINSFWINSTEISYNNSVQIKVNISDNNVVMGQYNFGNTCPQPQIYLENPEYHDTKIYSLSYNSSSDLYEGILLFDKFDAPYYNITVLKAQDSYSNQKITSVKEISNTSIIKILNTTPDFTAPKLLNVESNRSDFGTGDWIRISLQFQEGGSQIDKVWGFLGNFNDLYQYRLPVNFSHHPTTDRWVTSIQITSPYWPRALTINSITVNDTAGNKITYDNIEGIPGNFVLDHSDHILDSSPPLLIKLSHSKNLEISDFFEVTIHANDSGVGLNEATAIIVITGKGEEGISIVTSLFQINKDSREFLFLIPVVFLVYNRWQSILFISNTILIDKLGNRNEYDLDLDFFHEPALINYPSDWQFSNSYLTENNYIISDSETSNQINPKPLLRISYKINFTILLISVVTISRIIKYKFQY